MPEKPPTTRDESLEGRRTWVARWKSGSTLQRVILTRWRSYVLAVEVGCQKKPPTTRDESLEGAVEVDGEVEGLLNLPTSLYES
jgi:hypothetical protein